VETGHVFLVRAPPVLKNEVMGVNEDGTSISAGYDIFKVAAEQELEKRHFGDD
jgi:hypothetical protein